METTYSLLSASNSFNACFRSDYEGWKLVYVSNRLSLGISARVLEVTMRDGNLQIHQHQMTKPNIGMRFRSDYEGWKRLLIVRLALQSQRVFEVTMRDGNFA